MGWGVAESVLHPLPRQPPDLRSQHLQTTSAEIGLQVRASPYHVLSGACASYKYSDTLKLDFHIIAKLILKRNLPFFNMRVTDTAFCRKWAACTVTFTHLQGRQNPEAVILCTGTPMLLNLSRQLLCDKQCFPFPITHLPPEWWDTEALR